MANISVSDLNLNATDAFANSENLMNSMADLSENELKTTTGGFFFLKSMFSYSYVKPSYSYSSSYSGNCGCNGSSSYSGSYSYDSGHGKYDGSYSGSYDSGKGKGGYH